LGCPNVLKTVRHCRQLCSHHRQRPVAARSQGARSNDLAALRAYRRQWYRYYYPSTEKNRSTQFGAVGYIITLYSSKSYVKSWGSVQILRSSGPPLPPVVSPMTMKAIEVKIPKNTTTFACCLIKSVFVGPANGIERDACCNGRLHSRPIRPANTAG